MSLGTLQQAVDSLDESDRMLLSGLLKLGAGIGLAAGLEAAAGASLFAASAAAFGTVAAVSMAPVLIVGGLYAYSASANQKQELFAAAGETNAAVKKALRPLHALKDYVIEQLNGPEGADIDLEPPTTEETDPLTELGKGLINAGIDNADELLKPSKAMKDTTEKASTRTEGAGAPTCHPGDPWDRGWPYEGPVYNKLP